MYKILAGDTSYDVDIESGKTTGTLNGEPFDMDIALQGGVFSIIKNHRSYKARLEKADWNAKTITLVVDGQRFELSVKDRFDLLLEQMGMAGLNETKINEVKAPMPGLVLRVEVEANQEVQKDEPLLVLEAMKMENVIKSPTDGVIESINVEQGQAVEKGFVLITFK